MRVHSAHLLRIVTVSVRVTLFASGLCATGHSIWAVALHLDQLILRLREQFSDVGKSTQYETVGLAAAACERCRFAPSICALGTGLSRHRHAA